MSDVRPALVDLVLTDGTPGVAAYEATILDLMARGFLGIGSGPDGLRVTLTGRSAATAGLADYEQQVLGDVRVRLADAGGAPFAALAGACHADVDGTWKPFQEKLLAEGRRLGICRKRFWARPGTFLLITGVVAALGVIVPRLAWHAKIGTALIIGGASVLVLWWLMKAVGEDTLTRAGVALAAQWKRQRAVLAAAAPGPGGLDPASLERRAFAVAAGGPAGPGAPEGWPPRRAARTAGGPPPESGGRPAEIWSSFSGTWRQVSPEASDRLGSGGPEPGMMFSFAFVTLGLIVLAVLMTMNTIFLVPVTLAVVAVEVTFVGLGLRTVSRRSALPKTATFDGQVVARWQERVADSEGSGIVRCTVVDDGARAWTFTAQHVYTMTAVGDLVAVRFSPRTGELQRLTVTARPRRERSGGPG